MQPALPCALLCLLQVEKENIDMLVSFFESTNQLAPTATQEAAAVFQVSTTGSPPLMWLSAVHSAQTPQLLPFQGPPLPCLHCRERSKTWRERPRLGWGILWHCMDGKQEERLGEALGYWGQSASV